MSQHVFQVPAEHVHFVGVGGIGMSGIAKILLQDGYIVSGSDLALNRNTEELAALGGAMYQGHTALQAEGAGLIVVTSAARPDNPEVAWGQEHGIPVVKRAVFLGQQLMAQKVGVAISGTHGKTTTTAMVASILLRAGQDPTIACGGDLLALGSNAQLGHGPHFVAEADEFDRSFLQFKAQLRVITNIEPDHLDLYGTMDALREAFHEFATQGTVVLNADDPETAAIARNIGARARLFSLSEVPLDLHLHVPGRHYLANALAALAVADELGVERRHSLGALHDYQGSRRRLETIGRANGVEIVDTYAHHPTEIRADLAALKERRPSKLICVFQPHLYARTKDLFEEFAAAFGDADETIIVDTYSPAGREDTREVTSQDLARAAGVRYIPSLAEAAEAVEAAEGAIVVTMGAGTITNLAPMLLERLG
ncbi:MAG: UDP-N-acetylmuramate--L-alanine ligase [Chloroflexi bacterium]|nr:UDP-N-acetylmuramate--L-alanine ligase [Chloroflexota bacterium]